MMPYWWRAAIGSELAHIFLCNQRHFIVQRNDGIRFGVKRSDEQSVSDFHIVIIPL